MLFRLFICLLFISVMLNADNVIDNPTLLYQPPVPQNSALTQKITINRQFNTINELVQSLNQVSGIKAVVANMSQDKPIPVKVNLNNVPLIDLVNQTAVKLGYSWSWNNNLTIITFYALNPMKLVPVTSLKPVSINALPESGTMRAQSTWFLDSRDKTLANALNKWCKKAGWQLVWNVRQDYPIVVGVAIPGTFEHAVNEVLKASQTTDKPLFATMHDGSRVLEIYSTTDK